MTRVSKCPTILHIVVAFLFLLLGLLSPQEHVEGFLPLHVLTVRKQESFSGTNNKLSSIRHGSLKLQAGPPISIKILKSDEGDSVSVGGSERFRLQDYAIQSPETLAKFGLGFKDSDVLKKAVEKFYGKKPTNAFLGSPTPWNDLYKSWNWEQVYITLEPISGNILEQTSVPQIVASQTFENQSNVRITCTANIEQSVKESVTTGWSQSFTDSVSSKISVGLEVDVFSAGVETSISYSSTAGTSESKTFEKTLTTGTAVTFDLEPGQKAKADLVAKQGKLKCLVTYRQYLTGSVAVNYKNKYRNHHFWALSVGAIVQDNGFKPSISVKQEIEVDYFTEAQCIVTSLNDVSSDGELLFDGGIVEDGDILAKFDLERATPAPLFIIPGIDSQLEGRSFGSPGFSISVDEVVLGDQESKKLKKKNKMKED